MRDDDLDILDKITLEDLENRLGQHTRQQIPVDRYTAFSWSSSRHAMLHRCRRQYYLNYYGSRRVVKAKDRVISAVWWLKQITTLRAWVGSVMHHVAKTAIEAYRDGRTFPSDALVRHALHYYRDGLLASKRGTKHDGQWVSLFEHTYTGDPPTIDEGDVEALIIELTQKFLESDAFTKIRQAPSEAIREIDEPFQSFTLSGVSLLGEVRVFAIPDVLLHEGDSITIIDWKTGSVAHEGIREQAGVYQLYAHHEYDLPEGQITVQISDLAESGDSVEPPGGTPPVAEAEAFVRSSIQEMVDGMESIKHNTVHIKHFPMTDNRSLCRWCGFKRACWRHEGPYE